MIWVNNLVSYGTPNYYVQKLFSLNKGTHTVSVLKNGKPLTGQDSLYASAVTDSITNELMIKVVNASNSNQQAAISLEGCKRLPKEAFLTTLQGNDTGLVNSIIQPNAVAPLESTL